MNYTKIISDDNFKKYKGKHFNESWYRYIIDSDSDGYYDNGCLFKFRKNIFNDKLMALAINSFLEEAKKKHSGRGIAAGIIPGQKNARIITKTGQNEGQYVSSNISGYYDRPLREHRGLFDSQVVCRTTAFTLKNKELWSNALPFVEKCSRLYKKLGYRQWKLQKKEYDLINASLKIPKTVFTTITSNYNWRTACHSDSGDFSGGLGNLIVVGNNFTGGYLGFPQFKILIKIKPGDFLLMDSHQYHCNTKIHLTNPGGFRLSFVMYIREDMYKCKIKKYIKNKIYFI